jgi:hypothetical protein
MSDLPDEAIHFIEAVTAHFGAPQAVTFRDNIPKEAFMTKKFDDNNCGVLFRNENKKSPKHADYSGSLNAAGLDYWFDGYIRQSANGRKFISLKLKLKDAQPKAEPKAVAFSDEIGF